MAVLGVTLALAPQPRAAAQADGKSQLEQADKFALDGKLNLARAAYERAIKAGEPVDKDYVRSRNIGLCYLNGEPKNLQLAAKWFGIAVQLRPGTEETRFSYAQALGWGGQYDVAAQQFRILMSMRPTSTEYALGLSNNLYWKGDVPGALAVLERFLEYSPSQTEVRLNYARLLGYAKRYTDARNQYQVILQSDPKDLAARVGIAKITSWQNQLDIALQLFNKILESNPGYYDAVVGKAYTLLWMGQRDQARVLFAAARNRDPGDKEIAAVLKSLSAAPQKPKSPAVVVAKAERAKPKAPVVPVAIAEVKKPEPVTREAAIPAPVPATESVSATPVHNPVAEPDPVAALLVAAEAASAKGNFTDAIHHYHQVLERQPNAPGVKLQIARVLSWSKNYDDSIAQYDELLHSSPENLYAHTEKARVLSWAKKYNESLDEYRTALRLSESVEKPAVPPRDIRQEYARVLSWAQRYPDSLEQYRLLLPDGAQMEAKDTAVLVEKARVLAWSKRYDESIATYDLALKLDADNFEARLGKAQTTFWAGRLLVASVQLRTILQQRPRDPEASFTLAAVEHGLGNNGRSLSLLAAASQNSETQSLRDSIRAELRPILRFRYGLEDDREIVGVGTDTTTKVLRYTSAIEFNIHPDVRMEIINTTTNALSSNALLASNEPNAAAMETLARVNFRIKPWLRMIAGAGIGNTGGAFLGAVAKTNQHFTYDIHPVITHGSFRTDIAISRHIADYTPLAIDDNVMQQRYSISESYSWKQRVRMGAEYWYARYTVDAPGAPHLATNGNGGSLYVTPVSYRNERASIDAGVRYDSFTFDDGAENITKTINSAGFFTPRVYQRVSGTGHAAWDPHTRVHLEVNGTFGPQRIFGFASLTPPPATFGTTGSVGAQATFHLGRLQPTFAYDYFSTATPAFPAQRNGQYRSNVFSLGLTYRF
jgi:tetratricopeptide (TPR) repeat protein